MPLTSDDAFAMLRDVLEHTPEHGGEMMRAAATRVLGDLRDARAVPLLLRSFADWHDAPRTGAEQGFLALGGDTALAPLVTAVDSHEHEWVRSHAATTLGLLGDPRGAAALIRALERPEETWLVRSSAARAAGLLKAKEAVPALSATLLDAQVLWRAADALADIGDHAALPALMQAAKEVSASNRRTIAHAMSKFGEAAIPFLAELGLTLAPPKNETPRRELEGTVVELAQRFESERKPALRIAIATELGGRGAGAGDAIIPLLSRAAKRDPAWGVRNAAVIALGRIGRAEILPALVGVMRRETQIRSLQTAAARAIESVIDRTSAFEALVRWADDESEAVQRTALEVLSRAPSLLPLEKWTSLLESGGENAAAATRAIAKLVPESPRLRELAKSSDRRMRRAAIMALAEVGDVSFLRALRGTEELDPILAEAFVLLAATRENRA